MWKERRPSPCPGRVCEGLQLFTMRKDEKVLGDLARSKGAVSRRLAFVQYLSAICQTRTPRAWPAEGVMWSRRRDCLILRLPAGGCFASRRIPGNLVREASLVRPFPQACSMRRKESSVVEITRNRAIDWRLFGGLLAAAVLGLAAAIPYVCSLFGSACSSASRGASTKRTSCVCS